MPGSSGRVRHLQIKAAVSEATGPVTGVAQSCGTFLPATPYCPLFAICTQARKELFVLFFGWPGAGGPGWFPDRLSRTFDRRSGVPGRGAAAGLAGPPFQFQGQQRGSEKLNHEGRTKVTARRSRNPRRTEKRSSHNAKPPNWPGRQIGSGNRMRGAGSASNCKPLEQRKMLCLWRIDPSRATKISEDKWYGFWGFW